VNLAVRNQPVTALGTSPVMENEDYLDSREIVATVRAALDEDIGSGDLTAALVPDGSSLAELVCREHAVICGRPWFDQCFSLFDNRVKIEWLVAEGEKVKPGTIVCRIAGPARSLLTVERTALNFLQTLSAVATVTRRYVDEVEGTGCRVLDTRKTIPGLRKAEKYAVRCGGGHNHRTGLYDAILIKENHILAAGSICEALRKAEAVARPGMMVEIEVETLEELDQALNCGARRVLLDNFSLELLAAAVKTVAEEVETECSGNVTLENVREIAQTGVDYVSIGALTKNVNAVDFSLRFTS
jgi:nicotinate-nucleotide pyrophosphorylase (carboxylating)